MHSNVHILSENFKAHIPLNNSKALYSVHIPLEISTFQGVLQCAHSLEDSAHFFVDAASVRFEGTKPVRASLQCEELQYYTRYS